MFFGGAEAYERFYAEDEIEARGNVPSHGVILEIEITQMQLDLIVNMPNSTSWKVVGLGIEQQGFAHGGFKGSVSGLLKKVKGDVNMMRGAYPKEFQPVIDDFLLKIDNVLNGEEEKVVKLVLRDPSGLLEVEFNENENENENSTSSWIKKSEFIRHFSDNDDLGLIEQSYPSFKPENQLTTPAQVADLVRNAKRIACFSGAGISVESGIPPFRSSGTLNELGEIKATNEDASASSIWKTFNASEMTVQNFNNKEEIARAWWKMKHDLLGKISNAKPNPAHTFFGKMFEKGKLGKVITQNIDSMHQRGGVPHELVQEIHGNMRRLICSNFKTPFNLVPISDGACDFFMSEEEAKKENYFEGTDLPRCPKCESPLRTETVMFGQPLADDGIRQAQEEISKCDLLFVIGTSLIVKPASELPSVALRLKIPIVMINLDETQYDSHATALVRQPSGSFLQQVIELLA